MIQGGDPTGTGTGGPGYKFPDEIEGQGTYARGTVAMANAGPNTNGSQFFICHTDVGLPHSYTIFGKVTSGMEAVDSIATPPPIAETRPESEVVINKVTINGGLTRFRHTFAQIPLAFRPLLRRRLVGFRAALRPDRGQGRTGHMAKGCQEALH